MKQRFIKDHILRITYLIIVIVIVIALIRHMVLPRSTIRVSGRVISKNTGLPISDALVDVSSALSYESVTIGGNTKTDKSGKFSAKVRLGGWIGIKAWKSGYALNGISIDWIDTIFAKEIIVELRELTKSNLVSENIYKGGFSVGDGFSFQLGQVVEAESSYADIQLIKDREENMVILKSLEKGGLIFQPYSDDIDFYNTPEAPISGYTKQLPVLPNIIGVYYVLTRDGTHYAKIRLIPGFKQTPQGEDHSAYWPQWAYQFDSTRNLEIAITKEYTFPFYKFGLNRELLK